MIVLRRARNGAYRLTELDGAIFKLRYAAFRLARYFSRSRTTIPATPVLDRDDLSEVVQELANDDVSDENEV